MLKFEYTQEKLSSQLGKSRSHIANVLRLLSLPNRVKKHISSGDLSFGHARVWWHYLKIRLTKSLIEYR